MFRLAARSVAAPVARRSAFVAAPRMAAPQRFYSAGALDQEGIKSRILEVLTSFEKVDSTKVSFILLLSCSFSQAVQLTILPERRSPHHRRSRPPLPSPATSDSTRSTPSRLSWPLRVSLALSPPDATPQQRRDAVQYLEALVGELARESQADLLSMSILHHPTEEFSIEIPDEEADRITTVGQGECSFRCFPSSRARRPRCSRARRSRLLSSSRS